MKKTKPTIAELEKMLNSEEEFPMKILPNGEVRAIRKSKLKKLPKVITMKENLGGEYGRGVFAIYLPDTVLV